MLLSAFKNDVRAGRFQLVPVGSDVIAKAGDLAALCGAQPLPVVLRALDALHLATSVLLKCQKVATTDERMRSAAARLELELV